MVGLPSQELEDYVDDLLFLKDLQPQMVGIGPFIPHEDTPLGSAKPGLLELTCIMLSLTRLLLPEVLLPATTALGSLNPEGWEKGFNSGANVVMLNLSPPEFRKKYTLYNGKAAIPDESRLHLHLVHERIRKSGFIPEMGKGDHISLTSATPEC
jgi:biotin synthase